MKPIPLNLETAALAARIVWFETPAQALTQTVRFMAYAFARATHDDMQLLRAYLDDNDLREALDKAPPGIIDPRSWSYWHVMLDMHPAPPMPQRRFA